MRLRVGIVGLGSQWESRHLPALRALADRFEVRGICEQVAHRAQRAATELGTVPVDGFRALAARDVFDRDVGHALALDADHAVALPRDQHAEGVVPELGRKDAIGGNGRSAALHVAKNGAAHFKFAWS
jgi:predicted dehydrogenase